jgi:hypothetical protein
MREAYSGRCARDPIGCESGNAAIGAIDLLCLAGAPTFAVMALLTGGTDGGGQPDMLCSVTQHASPLNGMAVMYLLMSAFHSAPWVRLLSNRRDARPPGWSGRPPGSIDLGHTQPALVRAARRGSITGL